MGEIPCPMPLVEEALASYIHTRAETLQIRQTLTAALRKSVDYEFYPSQLALLCPSKSAAVIDQTFKTKGVYREYLKALNAHHQAVARYDALKSEIDELTNVNAQENCRNNQSSASEVQDYVRLLRHRQQCQKLQAIQTALTKMLYMDPNPSTIDVKTAVREKLGDPPEPPTVSMDQDEAQAQIQELSFRLQKSLLTSKAGLDMALSAANDAESLLASQPPIPINFRVAATQQAKGDLIAWIESELSKIPENDDSPEDEGVPSQESGYPEEQVNSQVHELYERYVSSRRELLEAVEAARKDLTHEEEDISESPPQLPDPQKGANGTTPNPSISASELLSYLPSLIQASRDESLLLQQTTFLKRQILQCTSDHKATIQRLAGESHLVPQDTTEVSAWDKAAAESHAKTEEFVKEQVEAGSESIANSKEILARLQARRKALEHLKRSL